ncbi:MAG TPA: hypothetical protein VMM15_30375, partial [Bradyrhizobium sp.]|nr:hypothetical protein [Bradyrhizobium sp.]
LMTFFYREMPGLIDNGHLFLAMPPLYRLKSGKDSAYARDDRHKDVLPATLLRARTRSTSAASRASAKCRPRI